MPIYEYECSQCKRVEEVLQSFSDKPLKKCKHCSGKMHKLISHSSFHLKGSGWYVTDYAKKSSSTSGKNKKAETPSSAKKDSKTAKSDKSPSSSE